VKFGNAKYTCEIWKRKGQEKPYNKSLTYLRRWLWDALIHWETNAEILEMARQKNSW